LGLSAKNMGDSICFRAEVLQRFGWGEGLTEDYAFRQKLLLAGIRIAYEPRAIGAGEAAANWAQARAQRARWLAGAYQSNRVSARELWKAALQRRDLALLDGALQARLPSYSTLTLLAGVGLLAGALASGLLWPWLPWAWLALFALAFFYPLLALACDRAPWQAYQVILTGPLFILWRTVLSLQARLQRRDQDWVRTPRQEE
ncbi:MAG: glycosyltransferase family 2 protein, partial [Anaerolineales bacterium]|nr:glycosyltransferase family 2 protein [Anaerolineales bacterium]